MSATVFASLAERIWYFTGAPTSNLSTMNTWTVDMMSDFYSSSPKMAALRFGTTEGLEQAANGTADGIQVLSRNTSAACLVAYLADGITVDAAYPSNCHYDPRYTDWYIPKLQVTDTNGHVHGGKTDTDISYEIEQARSADCLPACCSELIQLVWSQGNRSSTSTKCRWHG